MFSIDPNLISNFVNIFSVILVVLILGTSLKVLIKINKSLDNKIKEKEEKIRKYELELQKIQALKANQEDLDYLNKIAREFFNEQFNLKFNLTYLELGKKFTEDKRKENADFCFRMSELLYSGRKIKEEEIKEVINLFSEVLRKARLI